MLKFHGTERQQLTLIDADNQYHQRFQIKNPLIPVTSNFFQPSHEIKVKFLEINFVNSETSALLFPLN